MTSNIKAKINIEKALQQLSKLDNQTKYEERDNILSEINGNIQLSSKQFIPHKSRQQDGIKSKEFSLKSKESMESRKSKAKINDKENQLSMAKSESVGTSYAAISRTIQQKNTTIDQQKRYIETLKKSIEDLKKNKENSSNQESRVRSQQLAKLKNKQRQHIQNMKEIKVLKSNFQQIRRRYQQILAQKNAGKLKYDNLLSQNQQLTISIAHLKLQMQNTSRSNNGIQFQQQITILKQQIRKQHMQKQALQARALNFERRMNEYVLKFGETQQQFNDCQIKYYKLQNDYDNARVDRDQWEIRYSSLLKQSKAEKELHEAQSSKLKAKVKQSQSIVAQLQSDIYQITQAQKKKINEYQVNKHEDALKQSKKEMERLNFQLANCNKKWEDMKKQLINSFSLEKQSLIEQNRNMRSNIHHLSLQNDDLLQKEEWILRKSKELQIRMTQLQSQLQLKTQKNQSLMCDLEQNQQQINNLKKHIQKIEEESMLKIQSLKRHEQVIEFQYKQKQSQKQKIMTKINSLEVRLAQENESLNQKQSLLIAQNTSLSSQIQRLQQQNTSKIHILQQTVNDLKHSLKKKQEQVSAVHFICEQIKKQKCLYYERQKKIVEQINNEKRYYQQKYERQLQEYNSLSKSFNDTEAQNAELIKKNSQSIIDISNLKNQMNIIKEQLRIAFEKNDSISYRQDQIEIIHEQVQKLRLQCQNLCEELQLKSNKVDQLSELKENTQKQINNFRFQNKELISNIKILQYRKLQLEQIQSKQARQLQVMSNIINESNFTASKMKQQIIDKQNALIKIKIQLSLQIQTVQKLNANIENIQSKYSDLAQQHNYQLVHWEQQRLQLQRQWAILNEASQQERRALNNSRMSASYELDSTQNAISILKHQNIELQRIFGQEIERRNQTIRQLIKQKKALYDQLVGSKHD